MKVEDSERAATMAMRREGELQGDLLMTWAEMPRSPGHVFYNRLQEGLTLSSKRPASHSTRQRWAHRRCRRAAISACILIGSFEGLASERGIVWRCLALRGFNVVIWSGEDDPADTLVPRLAASGADLARVFFVEDVLEGKERRAFDPAKDIGPLKRAIEAAGGAVLIIVDTIVSAVAGDSHKNSETRRSLQPLVDLASGVKAALLGITHFSKGTSGREPIERIIGSVAFGALARVVMVAAKEPEAEDGTAGRRILARAKSNIGLDEGGFTYSLELVPMPGNAGR